MHGCIFETKAAQQSSVKRQASSVRRQAPPFIAIVNGNPARGSILITIFDILTNKTTRLTKIKLQLWGGPLGVNLREAKWSERKPCMGHGPWATGHGQASTVKRKASSVKRQASSGNRQASSVNRVWELILRHARLHL